MVATNPPLAKYVSRNGLTIGGLSWKSHLAELSKKRARTAGLFYKIRRYAPTDTLTLLYHGIFAPFLSYDLSVWALTYPSHLEHCPSKENLKNIVFL